MNAAPQTDTEALARLRELGDELEQLAARQYRLQMERLELRQRLRPSGQVEDEL